MSAPRRLPGISMTVAPPPPVAALPRMDVAAFVGFASTGPLHLPVAVESPAEYAAVFGPDAPLAWDVASNAPVLACLGAAVRLFFANGGVRCWVTRVARSAALEAAAGRSALPAAPLAMSNRFAIPGVLALPPAGGACVAADAIARCEGSWSDTVRVDTALQRTGFLLDDWLATDSPASHFAFTTLQPLVVGDLLELGDDASTCAYALVEGTHAAAFAGGPLEVVVHLCAAFEREQGAVSPSPSAATAEIAGLLGAGPALWLAAGTLQLDMPVSDQLAPGQWVRVVDSAGVAWLLIDEIDRSPAFEGSPPATSTTLVLATVLGPVWRELGPLLPPALAHPTRAQRLALDLRAIDADGSDQRLSALALSPAASGSFWEQQDDASWFLQPDDASGVVRTLARRYPIAPDSAAAPPLAWLPLGAQPLFGAGVGALPADGTALERDGLSLFASDLFIDPALADDAVDDLADHAELVRIIQPEPRPLLGMHAMLGVDVGSLFNEATLLALPDAIHLGWRRRAIDATPPLALDPVAAPPQWARHRGACVAVGDVPDLAGPDFGNFIDSDTRRLATPTLTGPAGEVRPGSYRLDWSDSEPGADYVLTQAGSADFGDEAEIFRGAGTQAVVSLQRDGVYHYRVLAERGDDRSAPSDPVTVLVRAEDWEQLDADVASLATEPHWLAIHRAALRLAAAGGDLLAVLAMPRHFRTAQAMRHAQRLRGVQQPPAVVDPLAFAAREARALSYGALYFPWLQCASADATAAISIVPPDGVATGILAARAAGRGAWIAAANEPMSQVVALTPLVAERDRQALQDAQINLLRDDPRGFFTLSADTLSQDDATTPINVRRLLILLRRIALQRGATWVFEPNGPALRRAVQRGFGELMKLLFDRGAFAGATPEQSFQVITDDSLNTPEDVDAGRFIVELRVAPSLPMRFIAVRLAQSGGQASVAEETS